VNQEPDPGDDEDHHPGERIEPEAPRHFERADAAVGQLQRQRREPVGHDDVMRGDAIRTHEPHERVDRHAERARHGGARHERRRLPAEIPDPDEAVQGRADSGEQGNEPD
jgi:hypothetical protein